MRGEYYPHLAELSEDEVAKQAPFGAKWRLLAQVEVRCYILISNISGSVKVAPLQILQFPVILPHKFQDAEKFNLQFSDFSEITETADKLRWLRYQKGLRQRDVADYAGIYRSTYIHYEEYGKDFYSPKHMEKIAQLFEVPVERLLDDYNLFLRNGQGKQIKAIRMKLGLTQREYADILWKTRVSGFPTASLPTMSNRALRLTMPQARASWQIVLSRRSRRRLR